MKHLSVIICLLLLFISNCIWGQTFSPSNGDANVSITPTLTITFNEGDVLQFPGGNSIGISKIDFSEPIIWLSTGGGLPPTPDNRLTINGHILTINLSETILEYNKKYLVYIPTGTLIVNGTPYSNLNNPSAPGWTFTTVDNAPKVITNGYTPARGSIDVDIATNLELTFNKNIQFNSTSENKVIELFEEGNAFPIETFQFAGNGVDRDTEVSIQNGNRLVINMTNDLKPNKTYYILIEKGSVEDLTNIPFTGISNPITWRFKTITTPPTTTFNPVNGSTSIYIHPSISARYDQAIRLIGGGEIIDLTSLISFTHSGGSVPFTASINTTKDLITIIPEGNLLSETVYTVTISAVENYSSDPQAEAQTTTFTTDNFIRWTGTASTDFSAASNWESSPTGSFSAIIGVVSEPNKYPEILNSVEIKHCTVEPGAQLKIPASKTLSVSGLFELQSSNNPNVGNASLLNEGTLSFIENGHGRALQNISTNSYPYYFSSPVSNASPQSIGSNSTFYRREAQNGGSWVSISPTTTFTEGVGYVAFDAPGSVWMFSGEFNNRDSYTFDAYRTTTPNNFGWNLAGNPFPCAIDWDRIAANQKNNLDNSFWLKLGHSGQQGTYNGNVPASTNMRPATPSHIPSMHAFYTKVSLSQTQGHLTIPKSARVESSAYTYLKSTVKKPKAPLIRFVGNNGQWNDETVIAFVNEASESIEKFDSEKIFALTNDNLVELYTNHSDTKLTIDTYPDYINGRAVKLGYRCNTAGTYNINLKDITDFEEQIDIILEDKIVGSKQPLSVGDNYSFSSEAGEFNDRFVVHISKKNEIPTNIDNNNHKIIVYSNNKTVYIKIPNLLSPRYAIYNVTGIKIDEGILLRDSINDINVAYNGLVIVKITSDNTSLTKKVLIK